MPVCSCSGCCLSHNELLFLPESTGLLVLRHIATCWRHGLCSDVSGHPRACMGNESAVLCTPQVTYGARAQGRRRAVWPWASEVHNSMSCWWIQSAWTTSCMDYTEHNPEVAIASGKPWLATYIKILQAALKAWPCNSMVKLNSVVHR